MWTPPIELTPEAQQMVARTRKRRQGFVWLRERRHELLDADLQHTLAQRSSPDPGGQAPVDTGILALATLVQAYGNVGDRDAVERTVMDKRWQRVLDGLGAAQPPCSQRTLCTFRLRLLAHNLEKTLRERTVALAEQTGGCGARPRRAALDSTPLCGAGRVEETRNRLGHALRKAVGLAAEALATSAEVIVEEAGLVLTGQSSLKAVLDLDGGEPTARERALCLVLEEVERWKSWREQPQRLAAQEPPMQEMLETMAQMVAQDTEPDPEGGPGGRRIKPHVAHDRRISLEAQDRRPGRKRSAKTFHGCKEHLLRDLDRKGTREVGGCPAHAPEYAGVELRAEAWEKSPGLLQLDMDLGSMASPRMVPWAAQGGTSSLARGYPVVPSSPSTIALLTSRMGRSLVRPARLCRWSPAQTPSFRPVRVTCARRARNAPPPDSATGGACPCARTSSARTSCVPSCRPSADGPRCGNARRWSMRSPISGHTKGGELATRACGKTSVMAVVMRR
jgi:hypothetical protein